MNNNTLRIEQASSPNGKADGAAFDLSQLSVTYVCSAGEWQEAPDSPAPSRGLETTTLPSDVRAQESAPASPPREWHEDLRIVGAVEAKGELAINASQDVESRLETALHSATETVAAQVSFAPRAPWVKSWRVRSAVFDEAMTRIEYAMNTLGMRRFRTFTDMLVLPEHSDVASRLDPSLDLSTPFTTNLRLKSAIPMPANMTDFLGDEMVRATVERLGCVIAPRAHNQGEYEQRMRWITEYPRAVLVTVGTRDLKLTLHVACSYLEAGAVGICIDLAHCTRPDVYKLGVALREFSPDAEIVVGNLATREQAKELLALKSGSNQRVFNALKVGVGGGSHCSTRIETQIGFPQLDAIRLISYMARRQGVPIIADSGIRYPGHVVAAHVVGAHSTYAAGIYSQCTELPHRTPDGLVITRGMASNGLRKQFRAVEPLKASEGVVKTQRPTQSVIEVFDRYEAGLRSAMTQLGVRNLEDLFRYSRFVYIEHGANAENHPTPQGVVGS